MKRDRRFDVTSYGAIGDGQYNNSVAIERAITLCHESGGGQVFFPAGTYLTGPIELRSHVELHLEAGATVLFSRDFDLYPLVLTHFEGRETVSCRSPLWGNHLENVSITGQGKFDGQGHAWRPAWKHQLSRDEWEELLALGGIVSDYREITIWWPSQAALEAQPLIRKLRTSHEPPRIEDYLPARDALRPNMVKFVGCRDVVFDGPTFSNSACWNIHLVFCENVLLRGLTVLNPWHAQNGDGIDIESCRNVEIVDCLVDVGDDAICLKSGKDEEGRRRNSPCENITVRDCTILHGHGGLTVGSEMSGGVRDVKVWNCAFRGTDVGLRFKTARGRGGVVEDIDIRDITMSDIKGAAISFDMYYVGTAWKEGQRPEPTPEPVTEGTPTFRRVYIERVQCQNAQVAIEVRGLPEMPVESIELQDICIEAEQGIILRDAKDVTLKEIHVIVERQPALDSHNVENLALVSFKGSTMNRELAEQIEAPALNGNGMLNGHSH